MTNFIFFDSFVRDYLVDRNLHRYTDTILRAIQDQKTTGSSNVRIDAEELDKLFPEVLAQWFFYTGPDENVVLARRPYQKEQWCVYLENCEIVVKTAKESGYNIVDIARKLKKFLACKLGYSVQVVDV